MLLVDTVLTLFSQLVFTKNALLETPLHIAALVGDFLLVKKFIECGASPTDKTSRSVDVFEYAVMSGNMELIKYLRQICRKNEVSVELSKSPRQSLPNGMNSSTDSDSYSVDEIAENDKLRKFFCAETTVEGLFEKFHSSTVEKKKGWKKYVNKVLQKKEGDFRRETIELMREYFVSKRMLETPNDFGKDKKYRIISLDGGGIKVFTSIIILQRLSLEFPKMFEECNLYCGCSASSFVVSLLCMGVSIEGVAELCENLLRYAFKKDPLAIAPVTKAKYSNEYLRAFCDTCFGDLRIKNLPRHICIPAYLIDSGAKVDENGNRYCKSETFNNIIHENENERLADICVRSAAAPTFFKPYQNYVDGGVVCNQPCGNIWPYLIGAKGIGIPRENIVCLSISAGKPTPCYIDAEKLGGAGVAQWAINLADLFGDARRDQTTHEAEMLLGDKYCRIDPILPSKIILDDADDIDEIKRIANSYNLEDLRKWMRENWN